ncbi:UvrD-helicase domain-containing protein [Tessaracoccus sp. HDW20]|nr:UvrD-helicase domain-containing protein [Tessaracoccus coleopterorum]
MAVRELYATRKAVEGLCTFDDVISRLRGALADDRTGALVRATLADRFPVVLVDEFQDTDPEQWDIIERAFVAPDRATILIGDPKQSIYGFRGADLGTYLRARQGAEVHTLAMNHRTDEPLVRAVVNLFGDVGLGSQEVTVGHVEARYKSRMALPTAERLWLRRHTADLLPGNDAEAAIGNDLVRQVRLLLANARFTQPDAPLAPATSPCSPGPGRAQPRSARPSPRRASPRCSRAARASGVRRRQATGRGSCAPWRSPPRRTSGWRR